jgi:leucyl aminopeptidase
MKFEIASTEKISYSSDIIIIAIDNKNNLMNAVGLAKL